MARKTGVGWNTALYTYKDELHRMPAQLEAQAQLVMERSAVAAKGEIFSQYPIGPGNKHRPGGMLRAGLTIQNVKLGVKLKTTAPHAWIYERGTKRRETRRGANRGRIRKHPTFTPISKAYQQSALEQVKRLIVEKGARVEGSPDIPI